MSILSAQSIREAVGRGNLEIDPFVDKKVVHPCGMSYGLTGSGYDLRIQDHLFIPAGGFALVTVMEYIGLDSMTQAVVLDKSTLARQGISCFNTKFEPGWFGYPTIEVVNHSMFTKHLESGQPLCQMEFQLLDRPTEMPYEGKYQNQPQEPVEAIREEVVRSLLLDRMFSTAGRDVFDRQGYSLMIDEDTAIRDINYRDAVLYDTPEEALKAALSGKGFPDLSLWTVS